MEKTREWLKSVFETGDIPTGDDFADLIDSFWHKGDLGQVAEGDGQPVTGGAVYAALVAVLESINIREVVSQLLNEMLPTMLGGYVQTGSIATLVQGLATQSWVSQQLAGKADTASVNTALEDKADAASVYSKTETDGLLAAKAPADNTYTKGEVDNLLTSKADTASVPAVTGFVTEQALNAALADKVSTNALQTALLEKVGTTAFNTLSGRVSELEERVGRPEEDSGLCRDMADTMDKTDEIILALKGGDSTLQTVDTLQQTNDE